MEESVIIDCPKCNVRVSTSTTHWTLDPNSKRGNEKGYFLVNCPSCSLPLLGESQRIYDLGQGYSNEYWDIAERIWPNAKSASLGSTVPKAAKQDIQDATKCLIHGIYSAAAVLCGRAAIPGWA